MRPIETRLIHFLNMDSTTISLPLSTELLLLDLETFKKDRFGRTSWSIQSFPEGFGTRKIPEPVLATKAVQESSFTSRMAANSCFRIAVYMTGPSICFIC